MDDVHKTHIVMQITFYFPGYLESIRISVCFWTYSILPIRL